MPRCDEWDGRWSSNNQREMNDYLIPLDAWSCQEPLFLNSRWRGKEGKAHSFRDLTRNDIMEINRMWGKSESETGTVEIRTKHVSSCLSRFLSATTQVVGKLP